MPHCFVILNYSIFIYEQRVLLYPSMPYGGKWDSLFVIFPINNRKNFFYILVYNYKIKNRYEICKSKI